MVCSLDPTMPVIADADTGFGGPAMVARTVTQYAKTGVAGLHIEDQVQTKRCGHLMGKQVVSREEYLTRVRAAVAARDAIPGGSDFVSCTLAILGKRELNPYSIRSSSLGPILHKFSAWKKPSHA